ncbi:MAG: hypothetical protein ACR2HR_09975 [Euzebya sp.]
MTRADVHYALAIDSQIWDASRIDPDLLDPVVRVDSIPGTAHPFVVIRDYQAPQGVYLEYFTISDATGTEVYRAPERKIELRGEMFEGRVRTRVPRLVLDRGDEHELSFFVDGELINSIPMFLEVGEGGDPSVIAEETLAKALGKGTVMWIVIPKAVKPNRLKKIKNRPRGLVYDNHQQAVWFVLDGATVYVFSGPTEQEIAGLTPQTSQVQIVARSKDMRSAVIRTQADVEVVPPDDSRWAKVAEAGIGKRLNLPDGEGAIERWRTNCTLYALTPVFAGAPSAVATGPAAATAAPEQAEQKAAVTKRPEDDIHVEAQIDQAVFDKLVAEGTSERVARGKAKSAFVRAEKKRILAEQQADG